jgi:hypothetical protein
MLPIGVTASSAFGTGRQSCASAAAAPANPAKAAASQTTQAARHFFTARASRFCRIDRLRVV